MNKSFTRLSTSNGCDGNIQDNKVDRNELTKVRVNVVGDWSKKKGSSNNVCFSKPTSKPQPKPTVKPDKSEKPRRLKSFNRYLTEEDNVESVNEYHDNLPETVEGTYKYDFNVTEIHDLIVKRFERQKKHEIKELEDLEETEQEYY